VYLCQVANELNSLTEIIYTQGVVIAELMATIGVTLFKRAAGCYMIPLLSCTSLCCSWLNSTIAFVVYGVMW